MRLYEDVRSPPDKINEQVSLTAELWFQPKTFSYICHSVFSMPYYKCAFIWANNDDISTPTAD
ncbi:hypothetical protein [Nostoc sp. MS1]|uniref:hypothetical protein n=1 Tax=Nostoc sp. MS1 TaxID=2764711 RepID=UPI001CC5BD43|nr:hypothetical protein [Nostoc sp. MS1]